LGNTSIYLGNTTTTIGNLTLTNVTISSGTANITSNITYATANAVVFTNSSSIGTTSANLTWNGTNFGIGTSSPAQALEISSTNSGSFSWQRTGVSAKKWTITSDNSGTYFNNNTDSINNVLALANGGNVGIGTSSPAQPLQIGDGTSAGYQVVRVLGTNCDLFMGQVPATRFGLSSGTYTTMYNDANQALAIGTIAAYPLVFGTSNAERARIDSSGNLGLGVTPNTWGSSYSGIYQNPSVSIASSGATFSAIGTNWYNNSGDKFRTTGYALVYGQAADTGQHQWYVSTASGTANNTVTFTQAMTLDASGRLGIGTTSPSSLLQVGTGAAASTVQAQFLGGVTVFENTGATANVPTITFNNDLDTGINGPGANILGFYTAGTERIRISSAGDLLVGTTSAAANQQGLVVVTPNTGGKLAGSFTNASSSSPYGVGVIYSAMSPNGAGQEFYVASDTTTTRFYVASNGGIGNYSANNVNLSDRREKTNFAPAGLYLDKICAIPVQTFNYIDQNREEDDGLTLGEVAQDVQAVAPELVSEGNWGTKDKPKMRLQIYQTDLQYALMKCIQEQQALIESLTTRLTALENK
jgi:hypothetical protein